MVYDLLVAIGYYIGFLVVGGLIGYFVGWIVYKVLDWLFAKYIKIGNVYEKLKSTFSKMPEINVASLLSYLVGIILGILVFNDILSLMPNVLTATQYSYVTNVLQWTMMVSSSLLLISIVVLIIAAGVIFSIFFTSYLYILIEGYNEYVAELLKLLLFLGFVWIITYYSLELLGFQYTLFDNIIGVFVILSIGLIVMRYITENISENAYYKNIKPFIQVFIYSIFVISSLSVLTVGYSNISANVESIFAWGFVVLFVLTLIPVLVKAIKESE
jgi:hypothetical protein